MSAPGPWSWQLQHVVFPRDLRRRRAARNVAPAADPPADAPASLPTPPDVADPFVAWLFARAGLSAAHYRPETLRRRLPACLRTLRARSPEHARQLLERSPDLVAAAVSALLVGVTTFFRDAEPFALLGGLLPELAGPQPGVHAWSAGCSDGAELYSVALLLAEAGLLAGSYLLGTDCRPDAIRRARDGRFDTAAIRAVPPELLRRYFEFRDGAWEVTAAVRRAVRWRAGDVLTTPEPGVWDVILFRNTAMYMRADAAYPLWERFEQALRPGGVLVLGKAERPAGATRLAAVGPCVFRRTRG
ncbi:MAG TPA: CheR family methyltransferase [Gemmataceae bacterium]